MTALLILVPIALFLSLIGLAGFVWSLSRGQFDDLDGARYRILIDEDDDRVNVDKDNQRKPVDSQARGFK
jgi:cbb3-type cytochrome oxidase maturation protein